jgi:peptide-methionine (S)-S-oxide reductase
MTASIAILAGGCFWGVEDLFRKLPGVLNTEVGYTGGKTAAPTYKEVKTGATGHAEAIRIEYDPERISYRQLIEFFFQIHDPTTLNRQGNDIGSQYRSAIFFLNKAQEETARATIADFEKSGVYGRKIMTEVVAAGPWFDAEAYHQDYLVTYPDGYTCHFVRPEWKLNR